MFKRRSSKDLSAKIGYDHVNGKASRSSSSSLTTSSAPVANVPHSHRKHPSFSSASSYRKTTGMPSPEGDSGGATDTSNSTGPSPLGGIKSLPPDGQTLAPESQAQEQQPQQQQQQQREQPQREQPQANGVAAVKPSGKSKSSSSTPKVAAEPPSKSLVIGEGVLFEGATEGCSAAVVGGRLVGTVKSRRLEITRAGRMEGTATVETAEIAGTFEGSLTVIKALKICSTGRFKGEVSFGSIVVENGGKLEGKVNFGGARDPIPERSEVPPAAGSAPSSSSSSSSSPSPSSSSPSLSKKTPTAPAAAAPAAPRTADQSRVAPVPDGRQSPE